MDGLWNGVEHWVTHPTHEMLHLFIKYLCEQIYVSDIITVIWLHYLHRIDTYPYLVKIYPDIFFLNIKDMCVTL